MNSRGIGGARSGCRSFEDYCLRKALCCPLLIQCVNRSNLTNPFALMYTLAI